MDRKTAKSLRLLLDKIVKQHSDEFEALGVGGSAISARYDEQVATIKVEFGPLTDNGEVLSRDAVEYSQMAELYGLDPDGLNKVVTVRGEKFKIVGFRARNHKYPVMAVKVANGKKYKLPVESIKLAQGLPVS